MEQKQVKLDVGCGKHKQPDHIGIDEIAFEGVDIVLNAGKDRLPFEDNSVDHIHTSHFMEHLEVSERIHFVNEAHRVLKEGGTLFIATPSWSSCRAYGDLTHKWPPVSEFWYQYLNKEWREVNAPHNTFYTCDFIVSGAGGVLHRDVDIRSDGFKQFAMMYYKEAAQDLQATLTKNKIKQ